TQPSNSFLNPDAAEWVPLHHGSESSSSDNNILINDEINFPPLNSTTINTQTTPNVTEHTDDITEPIDTSSENNSTNNNNNNNNNN
ncbi:unnamed protein product, partial [Rotaria magnacalcarata]